MKDKVVKLASTQDTPISDKDKELVDTIKKLDRFVGIGYGDIDPETGEEPIIFFGKKCSHLESSWLADELKDYVRGL